MKERRRIKYVKKVQLTLVTRSFVRCFRRQSLSTTREKNREEESLLSFLSGRLERTEFMGQNCSWLVKTSDFSFLSKEKIRRKQRDRETCSVRIKRKYHICGPSACLVVTGGTLCFFRECLARLTVMLIFIDSLTNSFPA